MTTTAIASSTRAWKRSGAITPRGETSAFLRTGESSSQAVHEFCAWFDEIQREQKREYELAVSQWRPPAEGVPWFPDAALAYLQSARWNETAFPCLELTSKSLFWSDEAYLEFVVVCNDRGSPWGLVPLCFRSSLIRGEPDDLARGCGVAWRGPPYLCGAGRAIGRANQLIEAGSISGVRSPAISLQLLPQ